MPSEKEILKRVLLFPKAALTVKGKKVSYLDLMSSGYVPSLNEAVRKVVPVISDRFSSIYEFIDNQGLLSDVRKRFYKTMLQVRMDYILRPAHRCCVSGKFCAAAQERLESGTEYTEKDFDAQYNTWKE